MSRIIMLVLDKLKLVGIFYTFSGTVLLWQLISCKPNTVGQLIKNVLNIEFFDLIVSISFINNVICCTASVYRRLTFVSP